MAESVADEPVLAKPDPRVEKQRQRNAKLLALLPAKMLNFTTVPVANHFGAPTNGHAHRRYQDIANKRTIDINIQLEARQGVRTAPLKPGQTRLKPNAGPDSSGPPTELKGFEAQGFIGERRYTKDTKDASAELHFRGAVALSLSVTPAASADEPIALLKQLDLKRMDDFAKTRATPEPKAPAKPAAKAAP